MRIEARMLAAGRRAERLSGTAPHSSEHRHGLPDPHVREPPPHAVFLSQSHV
jgi:hypothetical protein